MSALGKVVRAGVGRRRIQTFVMMLTTMMAVTASVLATGLLVASQAPFDQAFSRQHGAHLTVQFNGAKVDAARAAATGQVAGVTASAGPNPVLSLRPHVGRNSAGMTVGDKLAPMTVTGRADAGGPVDDLVLTSGKWATTTGQIVLSDQNAPLGVGDTMTFPELPGRPTLTVVGLARSVAESSEAWVQPAQLTALTASGTVPDYQMLYRFRDAATNNQIAADRVAVARAVPAGSMTAAASYLKVKLAVDRTSATYVPFVVAFGVLGLFMSVLIIGIVVSGAVGAATRRIGILKSLGFTPSQVVRAYIGQALLPAGVGTALGVVCGNLLAIPVMGDMETAFGTGTTVLAPWIDIAVPAAALAAVATTALVPALRAGRLRTVEALAFGRTPQNGRGRVIRRLTGRLPLPRSVSLGLANPFTRPGRTATMAAAVAFGTIGVTFGSGLAISLNAIQQGINRHSVGSVVVQTFGPPPPPAPGPGGETTTVKTKPVDLADVGRKIAAQPGTRRYFTTGETKISVAGLAGGTTVIPYQGDSSWGAYQMVSGRWFHGKGQAVVPSGFLNATSTHVGDTITLANQGHTSRVRIVGEVFDLREEGMVILTDSSSLAGLGAYVLPQSVQFDIDLKSGTDRQAYVQTLDQALAEYGISAQTNAGGMSNTVIAMDTLAAMLTLMLVVVAGLGVLNTVVLDTRERIHDLGVFKALGMSPKQTVVMVLTSVAGTGLVAGAIGVPIGVALHDYVLPVMGRAAGTKIPAEDMAAYDAPVLVALLLGGLVIATVGALLPAGWAARTRTATALRTE
ncbi:FtsX-like permease family protein [Streptomyces sp. RLB1-33]|uniref:ABC transporter permease n=1 Tax=Streptomyces mirabilis TaxID=68239 RepID=UPI00143ED284|nr:MULTISPECIES: ABC transporter permease [Streptomyces]QIY68659.1 ABC transporter permease [Streptomyces sp. RLB1-33]QUW84576.1 ABC transporter permease [Streptomyces mirabilis]